MKNTNHFLVLVVVFFVLSMQVHKSHATLSLGVLCGTAASGGTGFVLSLVGRFTGNTDCVRNSRVVKAFSSQEKTHKKPVGRILADATSDMLGCGAFAVIQQVSYESLGEVIEDENARNAISWGSGIIAGAATRLITNGIIHGALNFCGVKKQPSESMQLINNDGESGR
jgi:hypothetical protein